MTRTNKPVLVDKVISRPARVKIKVLAVGDETFHFRSSIPAPSLLKLAIKFREQSDSTATELIAWIESLLVTSDVKKWQRFVDDPEYPITVETLMEIVEWVMEGLSGRPTVAPSPSPRGRSTTKVISEAGITSIEEPASTTG